MKQNILVSITAYSEVNMEAPTFKQVSPILEIHNYMEDQSPIFHRHHYVHLHETCKFQCKNSKWQKISCKRVCTYHNKNTKNKHHCTTQSIILYSKKPTKHNKSNSSKTLQPIGSDLKISDGYKSKKI